MSDLIDRKELLDFLYELEEGSKTDDAEMAVKELIGYVASMPSVQPKRGKWYIENNGCIVLDVCDQCMRSVRHVAPFYDFCPHCGADMRGEAE